MKVQKCAAFSLCVLLGSLALSSSLMDSEQNYEELGKDSAKGESRQAPFSVSESNVCTKSTLGYGEGAMGRLGARHATSSPVKPSTSSQLPQSSHSTTSATPTHASESESKPAPTKKESKETPAAVPKDLPDGSSGGDDAQDGTRFRHEDKKDAETAAEPVLPSSGEEKSNVEEEGADTSKATQTEEAPKEEAASEEPAAVVPPLAPGAAPTTTTATPPAGAPKADIPSFREWTEKALEEEQKKKEEEKRKREEEKRKKEEEKEKKKIILQAQNPDPAIFVPPPAEASPPEPPTTKLKKNFATAECGAKVVSANPESNGAHNIISPSRDEYMLNKCQDRAWFVVELCESIKAFKIEMANFELYSSTPKEFRVTMGNSYPAREKDWALFGQFTAEDDRVVQSFSSNAGVFGKYAKVEILSHHGSEHYCPVSLFKIFGISEIELIGGDDDDDDDDDDDGHEQLLTEADADEEAAAAAATSEPVGIVDYLKEKVGETLERVKGVFTANDQSKLDMSAALNETSLIGNSFMYDAFCPECDLERFRDVYFFLATNYKQLIRTSKNPPMRRALENGICSSLGFDLGKANDSSVTPVTSQLMNFFQTLFGTSRTLALCNVLAAENGRLALAISQTFGPKTELETKLIGEIAGNNRSAMHDIDVAVSGEEEEDATTEKEGSGEVSQNSTDSNASSEESKEPAVVDVNPVHPSNTKLETKDQLGSKESNKTPKPTKKPSDQQTDVGGKKPDRSSDAASATSDSVPKDPPLKEPPPVVHVTPSSTAHISPSTSGQTQQQQESSSGKNGGNGAGGGQNQASRQESVWQKLSNKIKALERNVTLSSGYLEELSVRYKQQIEDLQLSVRQGSEALAETRQQRLKDQEQVDQIREELKLLANAVLSINTTLGTLSTWAVGFHVLFLVIEIGVGVMFLVFCAKRMRSYAAETAAATVNSSKIMLVSEHETSSVSNKSSPGKKMESKHHDHQIEVMASSSSPLLPPPPHVTDEEESASPRKESSFLSRRRPSGELRGVRYQLQHQQQHHHSPNHGSHRSNVNSRRRSLEVSSGGPVSSTQLLPSSASNTSLSRRQKRRMRERAVASSTPNKAGGRVEDLLLTPTKMNGDHHNMLTTPRNSPTKLGNGGDTTSTSCYSSSSEDAKVASTTQDDDDFEFKRPSSKQTLVPKKSALKKSSPLVKTANKFGVLNNSVHDDATPVKQQGVVRTLHFADSFSEMDGEESGSAVGGSNRRRPEQRQGKAPAQHRSLSTSPQRIGETAKRKEQFENFDPEQADWIKSNKKT